MLTSNVDDLITTVQQVQNVHGLHHLSIDELRAIGLLLTGYVRLADLNFAATHPEAAAEDLGTETAAREMLLAVTETQRRKLEHLRAQSTAQCARELHAALQRVLTWTASLPAAQRPLHQTLADALIDTCRLVQQEACASSGFLSVYRVFCDAYFLMSAPLAALESATDCEEIRRQIPVIRNALNFWMKQYHGWQDMEAQNDSSRAYAQHGRLLSFFAET